MRSVARSLGQKRFKRGRPVDATCLLLFEQGCIGYRQHRALAHVALRNQASGKEAAAVLTLGQPETPRKVDRHRLSENFHLALPLRLQLVEFERQPPARQDGRKQDRALGTSLVTKGENRLLGKQRIGEQQQPASRPHPVVQRDILIRRKRAGLRHDRRTKISGHWRQRIECPDFPVLTNNLCGPVDLAR